MTVVFYERGKNRERIRNKTRNKQGTTQEQTRNKAETNQEHTRNTPGTNQEQNRNKPGTNQEQNRNKWKCGAKEEQGKSVNHVPCLFTMFLEEWNPFFMLCIHFRQTFNWDWLLFCRLELSLMTSCRPLD